MRLNFFKTALFATMMALIVGAGVFAQGQGQTPPPGGAGAGRQGGGQAAAPQNLQVLPKEMTRQQVTQLMRTFTAALGVECSHCHVGTQQERAKDDNPKKGVARKMIAMTADINKVVKDVGDPAPEGAAKVTCFSCHRGSLKPLTAAPSGGGH